MAVLSKVTKCINLDLIDNYLNKCNNYQNKCKKVQRSNSCSTVHELKDRVRQGSIIVSLIFKTHIYNLFCFTNVWEIASYVGDTTPYPTCTDIPDVISSLEASRVCSKKKKHSAGLMIITWKVIERIIVRMPPPLSPPFIKVSGRWDFLKMAVIGGGMGNS